MGNDYIVSGLDNNLKRYDNTRGIMYLSNTISGLKFMVLDRYKWYLKMRGVNYEKEKN